jgi:hypothetical protein
MKGFGFLKHILVKYRLHGKNGGFLPAGMGVLVPVSSLHFNIH